MEKPSQCYYKILNLSTTATPKEIKKSYYELARKFHPDNYIEDEKFEALHTENFKLLSEAYSVLINPEKRQKYDQLIMGDIRKQQSQQFYDPSQSRSKQEDEKFENRNQFNQNVAQKLRKYTDYKDFLKNYEAHQQKHSYRTKLRTEGFEELNKKYGVGYDHYKSVEREYAHKYNKYRTGLKEEHYDTKENHEYYNRPLSERVRSQAKPAFKQMFNDLFNTKQPDDDSPRPAN